MRHTKQRLAVSTDKASLIRRLLIGNGHKQYYINIEARFMIANAVEFHLLKQNFSSYA